MKDTNVRRLLTLAILFAGVAVFSANAALINGGVACTEDPVTGCPNGIITLTLQGGTIMTLTVASDGEGGFDPFGYGADTSDGINFSFNAGGVTVTKFTGLGWTNMLADGSGPIPSGSGPTYVLPADLSGIGCGAENGTTCEPLGGWALNVPLMGFAVGDGAFYTITAPGEILSDLIVVYNSAANGGNAVVGFQSDPIPEPGSITMILGGIGTMAFGVIRRRRAAAKS